MISLGGGDKTIANTEMTLTTKEEMVEFASKYKNIEMFKDSDDETTYWFIMLFILLMYIDYDTQKLWESFAEEVKTIPVLLVNPASVKPRSPRGWR